MKQTAERVKTTDGGDEVDEAETSSVINVTNHQSAVHRVTYSQP